MADLTESDLIETRPARNRARLFSFLAELRQVGGFYAAPALHFSVAASRRSPTIADK
jgi:hypothetical protein